MRSSRRSFLALAGASIFATSAAADATAAETAAPDGASADTIPAPFDELPLIMGPQEADRAHASNLYPPRAVPDDGPIPCWQYSHTVKREIVVPEWALEAVRWRAAQFDDPHPYEIRQLLAEYAFVREQFRTPDGRDAIYALLEAIDADGEVNDAR